MKRIGATRVLVCDAARRDAAPSQRAPAGRAGLLLILGAAACGAPLDGGAPGTTPARDATVASVVAPDGRASTADPAPTSTAREPAHVAALTPLERMRILRMSPLPDVPPDPTNAFADDPAAARLGQALFFDPRLSDDGSVSCSTCHVPELGWSDGRRLARGLHDTDIHTPTLLNVAHQRWFFWDGRADTLWTQGLFPLENPDEHGADRLLVAHVLHGDARLAAGYAEVFGPLPALDDGARFPARARPVPDEPEHEHHRAWTSMDAADQTAVNRIFANVGKALAAYQRRLVARDAPIDRFVSGLRTGDAEHLAAVDEAVVRGAQLFVGRGSCHVCHGGPEFSDLEFHDALLPMGGAASIGRPGRLGAFRVLRNNPFSGAGAYSDDATAGGDKVLLLVPSEETYGAFKTPSLRNVALTAPYMHRGHFADLDEVLEHYSTLDRGAPRVGHHAATRKTESILRPLGLSAAERDDLRAFLEALTSTPVDASLARPPEGWEPPPHRPRSRTLADFEALSARNLEERPLEQLAGLDRVRAWRLRLDVERSLAEPESARFKAPLFLAGVEILEPREAAELAAFSGGRIFLRDLRALDVETARALCGFGAGGELYFDALPSLAVDVAEVLAAWPGDRLSFAGLRALSPAAAAALATFGGGLEFDGLPRIEPDVARALSRWGALAPGRMLTFDGAAAVDPAVAAVLAESRGWGLSLGGVARLDAELAAALAPGAFTLLRLDGVRHVEPAALDAMTRWRARVAELRALGPLDDAVRARLDAAPTIFVCEPPP